jgi:hypothetical protein
LELAAGLFEEGQGLHGETVANAAGGDFLPQGGRGNQAYIDDRFLLLGRRRLVRRDGNVKKGDLGIHGSGIGEQLAEEVSLAPDVAGLLAQFLEGVLLAGEVPFAEAAREFGFDGAGGVALLMDENNVAKLAERGIGDGGEDHHVDGTFELRPVNEAKIGVDEFVAVSGGAFDEIDEKVDVMGCGGDAQDYTVLGGVGFEKSAVEEDGPFGAAGESLWVAGAKGVVGRESVALMVGQRTLHALP